MDILLQKLRAAEKSAEEMVNACYVFALGRADITIEDGRELRDRLTVAKMNLAKAERAILEKVAMSAAKQVFKMKIRGEL